MVFSRRTTRAISATLARYNIQVRIRSRMSIPASINCRAGYTGVIFQASQVTVPQISDGLSHTYLIGEKYMDAAMYTNGADDSDNDAATQGFDNDMCRRGGEDDGPMSDRAGTQNMYIFGSAHAEGFTWRFAMARSTSSTIKSTQSYTATSQSRRWAERYFQFDSLSWTTPSAALIGCDGRCVEFHLEPWASTNTTLADSNARAGLWRRSLSEWRTAGRLFARFRSGAKSGQLSMRGARRVATQKRNGALLADDGGHRGGGKCHRSGWGPKRPR